MTGGPLVDELEPAFDRSRLDVDEIRARCERVLGRDLFWFPIRHHSPACARHLELAIRKRRPSILFVEGPSEAGDLVAHVVDPKTRPPVAIYSAFCERSQDDGPSDAAPGRSASFFPLLPYSPEYVAMAAARRLDLEVCFIDLPHFALPQRWIAAPSALVVERESDRLITESSFFRELTRASGYRSWDEAWDSLFEIREFAGPDQFRREMAFFCAAARATADARSLVQDGTPERERFMRRTIERELARRAISPADAMVVCGGFHLFHDETDATPPPEVPEGALYTTLVPFSYARVSALSGYAAGNRAPLFYERLWEAARGRGTGDVATTHAIEVIREARRRGEPLSSADAIAAAHAADLLARLRRRAGAGLDDIHDALLTCCCKGDPAQTGHRLLRAMALVATGSRVGKVTRAVRRLPLVEDFHVQLRELDLEQLSESDEELRLTLDLRDEVQGRRSAFLHRLALLDVPVGSLSGSPPLRARMFEELWSLRWTPGIAAALIERSPYGDTIERAALAVLDERIREAAARADDVCRYLLEALRLGLPGRLSTLTVACRDAIDADGRFAALARALSCLVELRQVLGFRGLDDRSAAELILRCFDRACLAIPGVSSAPEEEHEAVLGGLLELAGASTRDDPPGLDHKLFTGQVRQTLEATTVPFLRGAFLGLLIELKQETVSALVTELSALALSPPDHLARAGEFLEGVMAASRASVLLEADTLAGAIDRLLRAADAEPFLTMLPRLRAAFERLGDRARREFAACIARRYGLAGPAALERPIRSANVLATLLDEQTAAIMKEWEA